MLFVQLQAIYSFLQFSATCPNGGRTVKLSFKQYVIQLLNKQLVFALRFPAKQTCKVCGADKASLSFTRTALLNFNFSDQEASRNLEFMQGMCMYHFMNI